MPPNIQLVFAANWMHLGHQPTACPAREVSFEARSGYQVRLERGLHLGLPAIWADWSDIHRPDPTPGKHSSGLAVALAAAVEASPEAQSWLFLLSHTTTQNDEWLLGSRIQLLEGNTIVVWMSGDNELIAAGFSSELYSELIHMDSMHALTRLLRRYPSLQIDEVAGSAMLAPKTTLVNR